MNYRKIYDDIIDRAKARDHVVEGELHHIIPASMCKRSKRYGDRPEAQYDMYADDSSNIVLLTYREHYLAHWILYKIYRNTETSFGWRNMSMDVNGVRYISHTYKYMKKHIISPRIGMRHTDETKRLISINTSKSMKGLKQSASHVENKARTKRIPVEATSITDGSVLKFKCARDAMSLGFKPSAISRCCNGKNKTHGGYSWAFAGEA